MISRLFVFHGQGTVRFSMSLPFAFRSELHVDHWYRFYLDHVFLLAPAPTDLDVFFVVMCLCYSLCLF